MKIAFVTDAIYPYNKGGKEKRLFDISVRLSQDNHDVHIYTMKWWNGPNVKIENGVTLHAISKLYQLYSGNRRSVKEGLFFGLSCLRLLAEDWDVIDVDHMPFFPLYSVKFVCLLKGKKMYVTWHEVWGREYWNKYLGKSGNIAYLIERLSVFMPDKIISVSKHTTNKLKKDLFSKKEIITIPDGIDVSHINKVKPSPAKSDVIFAGRLLLHKNVDILVKSIAILKEKIPSIKCLIIGDGPEKNKLERMVSSLNLTNNVFFLGFLENHDEVYSLIKSSKVFVLPSTREGFGIVVAESLACGTSVITVDHPDNAAKDLIKEGINGYLAEPNERSIADKILKIMQIHDSMEPRRGIEQYDWPFIIQKIKQSFVFG